MAGSCAAGSGALTGNSRGASALLKDSIPIAEFSASGLFEGHDLLRRGFTSVKNELLPSHPLELSEKNFQLNQDKTNFDTLRNIQGLHAPLKLQMEFRAVKQVQRLPFLHSSNIALDTLRGNDECISFEDILNAGAGLDNFDVSGGIEGIDMPIYGSKTLWYTQKERSFTE